MRAAASSIASGRLSSLAQIASTVASGSVSRPTARARSTKSATASVGSSGSSGYSTSPEIRSGARLVASTRRPGGRGQEVGNRRCRGQEVLEVVEEQHELAVAEKAAEVVGGADRLRDLARDEIRVDERAEGDPEDTVRDRADELGSDLQREPGLSRTARPRDRDETSSLE